jgi:hypothetical protein
MGAVYLQGQKLPACRARRSIWRAEIRLPAEPQVPACRAGSVYLQSQQQSTCIASNNLRAEPKAVLITGPDAHILSNTNLTWIEICRIRLKESLQALKVDAGSFFQSTLYLLRNTQHHIQQDRILQQTNNLVNDNETQCNKTHSFMLNIHPSQCKAGFHHAA